MRCRPGFTIVELLVVIAIVGLLVGLSGIAVQAARDQARRMQCQNNLRQLGIAIHEHVEANGHFPTGGWGWRWAGDPDRGTDERQPGSWIYNILPFLEQTPLWKLGQSDNDANKRLAGKQRSETSLPMLVCASSPLNFSA
jgi:prepilin-type N-terminal cleavage/methylation domain-containing protein